MYHINNEGKIGICRAEKGMCPFGKSVHFNSIEKAETWLNNKNKDEYGLLPNTHERYRFIEYLAQMDATVEDLADWAATWIVEQEWEFPEFIGSFPSELRKPFEVEGTMYRSITLGDPGDVEKSGFCSWSPDYDEVVDFRNLRYIELIEEDGYEPIIHIYRQQGKFFSFNKLVNTILEYDENYGGVDEKIIEELKTRYEDYKNEDEHFAPFSKKGFMESFYPRDRD